MSTHTVDAEEIIDGYKSAVEHANGHLFASMLKVSHADGWFTVRDLDGTESRYRQKEILSVTRELLKQPAYKPESLADILAEVKVSKVESVLKIPTPSPAARSSGMIEPLQDCVSHANSLPQHDEIASAPAATRVIADSLAEVALAPHQHPSSKKAAPSQPVDPARDAASQKVVPFPTPQSSTREVEDRVYKRNLHRIFFIVGAVFVAVIIFFLLKKR